MGKPIYMAEFKWSWIWEEGVYKRDVADFLKREDVIILSVTILEKETTILYQNP